VGERRPSKALETWLAAGRVQLRETVYDGWRLRLPRSRRMFESNKNIGKTIVRVAR